MDVLGRGDGDSVGCALVVKGPWVAWVSVTRHRGVCELDVQGGVWTWMAAVCVCHYVGAQSHFVLRWL